MEGVPTVLRQNRSMAEQSSSDDRATLRLEPGIPGENTLTVRISPACAAEFVDLLDSHDLSHSEVFEASYSDGLSIYLVYAVGGLVALGGFGGLAKVLVALFHRRDGKRFTAVIDGDVYSAEGTSLKEAERWIEQTLAKKAQLDSQWAQLRRRPNGEEGPSDPPEPPLPSDV
jgi:hypothetical protein